MTRVAIGIAIVVANIVAFAAIERHSGGTELAEMVPVPPGAWHPVTTRKALEMPQ